MIFRLKQEEKFHCTVESGRFNDLPLHDFFYFACSNSANTCMAGQAASCSAAHIHITTPKGEMRKRSNVSNKPINIEQTDCSLSELKWAAHCVLSRQLNFRQLNILGNVWKLNCEGEQRGLGGMKRCGETQKALSYPGARCPTLAGSAETHTCAPHTHQ